MRSWSRRVLLLGGAGCLFAACSSGWVGTLPYSVSVNGEGNQVVILQKSAMRGGGIMVTVQSARGIGDATVAWWGQGTPCALVIQLELRGLEHFSLRWAEQAVFVSVNSADNSVFQSVQKREEQEMMIDQSSPFWMDVSVSSRPGIRTASNAIDHESGYRITTPPAFQAAWPGIWSITWVDFYR